MTCDQGPGPDINRRKEGKTRVELVPPGVMEAIATTMVAVLQLELKNEDDWFVLLNDPPRAVERAMAAAVNRHSLASMYGEEFDPETGLPHVWHILTGAAIWSALLYFRQHVQRLESLKPGFTDLGEPPGDPPSEPKVPGKTENTWTSDLQEERPSWLDTHDGQEASGAYLNTEEYVRRAEAYLKAETLKAITKERK